METAVLLTASRRRCTQFLRAALGVLALVQTVSGGAAVEYELRVLDGYVTPTDINDNGWVVGRNSYYGSAVLRAGRLRTLVSYATANAVNNAGIVVGERTDTSGIRHAFRTAPTQSDVIEDLGLLANGTFNVATAINENSVTAGYANTLVNGTLVDQAVYFLAGQKEPKSIGHLALDGGKAAYAYGINDNGDIVGAFIRAADGKYRPFRYLAGGTATPLPGFDDVAEARAVAINNHGRIIGNLTFPDGRQRGFIFENGTRTDIESPEGKNTSAHGLNEAGQVVGRAICGTLECGFLLDGTSFTDLTSWFPQKSSNGAYAINKHGEIAMHYCYINCYSYVLSPRRPRPVVQYSGLPLLRAPKAGDLFGSAIALHGNVAVIGAPGENGGTGAVYVYRYSDLGWIEEPPLTAINAKPGGGFGASVAFDGDTIVVGAPYAGAAYVFKPSGSSWEQTAILSKDSTTTDAFGSAVAVKGTRIVVGAPYAREKSANYYSGAVYMFDWNGTQWDRSKRVPADLPENTSSLLGTSVQIDGDSVLAGAPYSCWGNCVGAVYVFQRQTNGWSESKLTGYSSADYGFGTQVVVQNDILAVRSSTYARVTLYRRGTAAENVPWTEQDWITSYGPVAVDGDRLVITENYAGKYLPLLLKREGRTWVDEFNVMPDSVGVSALALQGSTLLVGSKTSTGEGVVTPFSICAEPPCTNMAAADIEVKIEAPATARTSELMTQTLVVTNLHDTATAGFVTTESTFTDSNGITPSYIGVPEECRVSLLLAKVTCGVSGLAAKQQARFELRVAAPAVAGGTLTHKASALHARPDPDPANNMATATTTIMPSGEPRIEIYTPYDGQNVKREPNESIELRFEIQNFTVAPNGDYFTVSVDGATPLPYSQPQIINLGPMSQGLHSVKIALMLKNSTTPVVTKTTSFSVEVTTPSVVIGYPRAGEPVICRRGELIAPRVKIHYWTLGEGGKNLQLQMDGQPLGDVIANEDGVSAVNLCGLSLDAAHTVIAVLRDGNGNVKATSDPITFELRKLAPKVTILQPVDGGVGFARGGFTLIYKFDPGYDPAQVAITLNGIALPGPLPTETGTNSVPLPAESLRDGGNELLITVTMEGREVQTSVVRFTTQAAATPPKSKGGALGLWTLLLLALMRAVRRERKSKRRSRRNLRGVA